MLDTVIFEGDVLSPARRAELQQRTNGPGLRRLAAHGSMYLSSALLLVFSSPGTPIFWVALGVSGLAQFAMFGMLHEACHRTPFRSRALNAFAGWFAALAQPMSPALMRAFHFAHHRHTHELEKDPELGGMPMMARWPRGALWLITVSGLPIVMARLGWTLFAALTPPSLGAKAWELVLPFTTPAQRPRIAWEARALVLVHAAIITLALYVAPGLWWVYVGMLIGHALVSVYITCEHRGLPMEGDILARTRSVAVPGVVRWLLWNMPYHAEHHAWPAVPFHALPELHTEVAEALPHRESLWKLHLRHGRAS